MTQSFCKDVITIPQINGTCWFNALMMMIFYSQNSRKLLLHYKPFEGRNDILSNTFKSILNKNYKLDEKTIKFFSENNIDSILSKFNLDPKVADIMAKKGYLIPFFISNIFNAINCDYITIDYFNTVSYNNYGRLMKNYYFGITETISQFIDYNGSIAIASILNDYYERQRYKSYLKNKIRTIIPKYLIINLWSTQDYLIGFFGYNAQQILNDFYYLNGEFTFNISGIYELSNEIQYNGYTYVLDSVAICNYNVDEINIGHAIAGITCKNNRYVYNGWIRNTNDQAMKTGVDRTLPCELMPFNWDINSSNDFCLNHNQCNLKGFLNYNDLCFSFDKGNRTLVYVLKDDNYKSVDYNIKSKSKSKSKPILKSNDINASPIFKTIDKSSSKKYYPSYDKEKLLESVEKIIRKKSQEAKEKNKKDEIEEKFYSLDSSKSSNSSNSSKSKKSNEKITKIEKNKLIMKNKILESQNKIKKLNQDKLKIEKNIKLEKIKFKKLIKFYNKIYNK